MRRSALSESGEHLVFAVYGSLMTGFRPAILAPVSAGMRDLGPARIRGRLIDLGGYPGLLPDRDGSVAARLMRIEPWALPAIDRYEFYDANGARGPWARSLFDLVEPDGERAWVYWWTGAYDAGPLVMADSWPEHLRERGEG